MLHSDCSGLIGKLYCHVFHCTAHSTLKDWSHESDLTKNPLLSSICNLKAAYREKPLPLPTITALQEAAVDLTCFISIWCTEVLKPCRQVAPANDCGSSTHPHFKNDSNSDTSNFRNLKRNTGCTLHGTDSTYGHSYSSLFSQHLLLRYYTRYTPYKKKTV